MSKTEKGHLIVDCGGTKAQWVHLYKGDNTSYMTAGYNPYSSADPTVFKKSIQDVIKISKNNIDSIYFYGAGCNSPLMQSKVKNILHSIWPLSEVIIDHDLLGAARGCCGDKPGIVCILGTGSNSCYYDGTDIIRNIPSLGYLLADEGSGATLGKSLLKTYFRKGLSPEMTRKFELHVQMSSNELLTKIYQEPEKARYFASFSKFIHDHLQDDEINLLANKVFKTFFNDVLLEYQEVKKVPVHFTGSISYFYKDLIKGLAISNGITIGSISQSPMDNLLTYHTFK